MILKNPCFMSTGSKQPLNSYFICASTGVNTNSFIGKTTLLKNLLSERDRLVFSQFFDIRGSLENVKPFLRLL